MFKAPEEIEPLPPLPRSLLFAPATSPRKLEKAFTGPADAVVLDLEDAVAVSEKPAVREIVAGLIRQEQPRPVYVRVNATTTPFCFQDLLAVGGGILAGIMLPKVESPSQVTMVDWILTQIETQHGRPQGRVQIIPLIETALGLAAANEIARSSPRVRRLSFGAVDLALDMDLDLNDDAGPMAQARFIVALASRTAGLEGPLDTAFVDIHDLDRLRTSAMRARAMGYKGKGCIHPAQVETVNDVFTPGAQELAQAQRLVAAFVQAEASGSASVAVDGIMVDYPVYEKARRVLAAGRR